MKINPNKAISANGKGIIIFYTDSWKSHNIYYDEQSILKPTQVEGNGTKKYQKVVVDNPNRTQKTLYNEAMYGLNNYTESQISKMTYVEKMRIKEIYDLTQYHLNIWKQQIVHNKIGSFMTTFFHKSKLAAEIAHFPKHINTWDKSPLTLRQLGIRKEMIEEKLINLGILPQNYYQLAA